MVDEGRVAYAGRAPGAPTGTDAGVDLAGRCVMPGFVDSHTHLIFAGDRAEEFALRMAGRPYRPGGILDTVAATRAAPPDELEADARRLIDQALASGTTTVEIKTGYGLTPIDEAAASRHRPGPLTPKPPSWAPTWCRPSSPGTVTATSDCSPRP